MNYQLIHDNIVSRARLRIFNKGEHELHHVIPRHEDKNSTDIIPVTVKEHRILHFLRYKITGTWQNKNAYTFMKGKIIEARRELSSNAGKLGGKSTKEKQSGIFDPNWDRSLETKRRWEIGILNSTMFPPEKMCLGGKSTKEKQSGIFDPNWDRSAQMKSEWASGSRDHIKQLMRDRGREIAKLLTWTNGYDNIKSNQYPGEGWFIGQTQKDGKVVKYKQYMGISVEDIMLNLMKGNTQ